MEKETPAVNPPAQTNQERLEEAKQVNDRLYDLMHRCNNPAKPDPQARKELNSFIAEGGPIVTEIMKRQNGLYSYALSQRIDKYGGTDAFKETILFKCNDLRDRLGYQDANQLERLAIAQVVLCWLNLHLTELGYSDAFSRSLTLTLGIYWEKRLTMASKRYNKALETLSKMRKMKLTVQINNAQNQIVNNG
ncbi:hypothetical protein GCM10023189_59110 [Nibrella saemangeumensis]|uniref:Uncharacterized protein n=1 Tax=Nibrella saemangeumensis TaxID=1084526 RepID=A0ABP8NS89_9BACT